MGIILCKCIVKLTVFRAGLLTCCLVWRRGRWRRVGVVQELLIYPLKGARALAVDHIECGERGPSTAGILDRGFMIGTTDVRHNVINNFGFPANVLTPGRSNRLQRDLPSCGLDQVVSAGRWLLEVGR